MYRAVRVAVFRQVSVVVVFPLLEMIRRSLFHRPTVPILTCRGVLFPWVGGIVLQVGAIVDVELQQPADDWKRGGSENGIGNGWRPDFAARGGAAGVPLEWCVR